MGKPGRPTKAAAAARAANAPKSKSAMQEDAYAKAVHPEHEFTPEWALVKGALPLVPPGCDPVTGKGLRTLRDPRGDDRHGRH